MTVHYLMENGEMVTRGSSMDESEILNSLQGIEELEIVESSIGSKVRSILFFSNRFKNWVTAERREVIK